MSEWKKTTCCLCAVNCGLEVQTEGNRITKTRPDKDSPRSQGYACRKGLSISYFQDHGDRLTHPLKRVGERFERISWEQATTEIAAKLKKIVDAHGPKSLALMGGAGLGDHLGAPFASGLLHGLGSKYHYTALSQELTGYFFIQGEAYGRQAMHPFPDVEHTDVLVLWGSNAWRAHQMNRARPVITAISKDPEKLLIVIDPCKTETADRADIHIAPRPGTDALLMKAMIAILLEENIYNKQHIEHYTTGFDEIKRHFEGFNITEAMKVCRLDEEEIRELTRLLAGRKCSIRSDLGLLMSRNSTINSYVEMLLLNLLGRIGKNGGNVFLGHVLEFGPHTPIDDPNNWRTIETDFPAIMGLHPPNVMPEEIMSDKPERLRAVIVSNSNPLRSYADTKAYEEAFARLDLLVTADIAMSETARLSHYVLPAKSPYEKWSGTFFSWKYPECYFHLRRPVCESVGEPREDGQIWTDIADTLGLIPEYPAELEELAAKDRLQYAMALMGYLDENPDGAATLPFVVAKTLGKALGSVQLSAVWAVLAQYSQTGGAKLERAGYELTPMLGDQLFQRLLDSADDLLLGVQDTENNIGENIKTPDGKIHLHIPVLDDWMDKINPTDELRSLENPNPNYPMTLMAGARSDFNATTRMRNKEWITDKHPCTMRIHPEDARQLGLETEGLALVETEASSVEVEVEISERICRGIIVIPHGFGLEHCGETVGVNVNCLTPARNRDPLAATPLHKSVPCRVSAK